MRFEKGLSGFHEPRLEALSPRLFREHLVPLGYRFSGSCEGLSFYTANASWSATS